MLDHTLLGGQLEESERRIVRATGRARELRYHGFEPLSLFGPLYLLLLSHKALLLCADAS